MWVFGYGSLVWSADFTYTRKRVGHVKGFIRRFWQASDDHRGLPGRPGRVVTLLPTSDLEAQVWGVAYEIPEGHEQTVLKQLDRREQNGYHRATTVFYPAPAAAEDAGPSEPFELVVYVGSEENPWFVGAADMDTMAHQIASSAGASGTNRDYLYQLADAMRRLAPGVDDDHLFALESTVRLLDQGQHEGVDRRWEEEHGGEEGGEGEEHVSH